MARTFAIDPVEQIDSIEVEEGKKGSVKFFVTNTSNLALDGEIKIDLEGGELDWFSPEIKVISFSAKGKQEITVELDAPKGVPKEKRKGKFRLIVTAQGVPDDNDFTEGPYVRFELIPGNGPPPCWERGWWYCWWIWVVVGVVVVGATVGIFLGVKSCNRPGIGEACEKDQDCEGDPPLVCHTESKTCRLPEGGEGCKRPEDCDTNYCENKICVQECGGFNQPCGAAKKCCDKLACVGGFCLKKNGQPCSAGQHCASGYCHGGKCKSTDTKPGSPCLPGGMCSGGLVCHNGKCLIPDGGTCKESKYCKSRICFKQKCVRQIDCHNGICPLGLVCERGICKKMRMSRCVLTDRLAKGYRCLEGIRIHVGSLRSCESARSCQSNENCVGGQCQAALWCESDADCLSKFQCKFGLCRPRSAAAIVDSRVDWHKAIHKVVIRPGP